MPTHPELHGVFPYLPSPLDDVGRVNRPVLARLVEHLTTAGVHGLTPLGSTGEFACLNREQRLEIVETVVEAARGRMPVIAGVAATTTRDGAALAREVMACGADSVLAVLEAYFPIPDDVPTPASGVRVSPGTGDGGVSVLPITLCPAALRSARSPVVSPFGVPGGATPCRSLGVDEVPPTPPPRELPAAGAWAWAADAHRTARKVAWIKARMEFPPVVVADLTETRVVGSCGRRSPERKVDLQRSLHE